MTRLLSLLVLWLLAPASARANFHLMKIVEIFPGTAAAPDAQYVVLQMTFSGQNIVGGHKITVFDRDGVLTNTFTFSGSVPNGANQEKILIATPDAVAFFGISANLTMTPALNPDGGKVCFDALPIDCVAWGSYIGPSNNTVGRVGTPFNPASDPLLGQPNIGLIAGQAIKRRTDFAGSATLLEEIDDTNDCARDFFLADPAPKNNARVLGTIPSSVCGNSLVEGVETCDDGNSEEGDSCTSLCKTSFCGDGLLRRDLIDPIQEGYEECDDLNRIEDDTCSNSCQIPRCGDGAVQGAELCDDGNTNNGDGCDNTCKIEVVKCSASPHGELPVLLMIGFFGVLLYRRRLTLS